MPDGVSQAAGTLHHADRPEQFGAALQGGSFEFSATPGARFAATLRLLQLGDLVIQHARLDAHRSRSALWPGLSTLLVPLRTGAILPEVNGMPVGAASLLLVPGGKQFECNAPTPLEWAAVALPQPLLQHWPEADPAAAQAGGSLSLLASSRRAARKLADGLSFAAHLAEDLPEFLLSGNGAQAIGMALREALAECLSTAHLDGLSRPRAGRDACRIVQNAEVLLMSRIDEPVYTEELCAALGASARKLHDAFVATVGMSPHAYLKARRLVLARRALMRRSADAAQRVKTVALAHGFVHFGNFAKDYRRMFGEAPSATFASDRP